jgi:hypothetical protein
VVGDLAPGVKTEIEIEIEAGAHFVAVDFCHVALLRGSF